MTSSLSVEIWQIIQRINAAWLSGQPEHAAEFFADDIVVVQPHFQGRMQGKHAFIESYQDFMRQAKVHDYQELNPSGDVFGDTAIVSYAFDISYEMGGQTFHDTGHDLFVLVRKSGQWQAVWRTLVPNTGEASQ